MAVFIFQLYKHVVQIVEKFIKKVKSKKNLSIKLSVCFVIYC